MEKWFDRARAAMKKNGITQADLAEHFGMTQPGMQKWLSGDRDPNLDDLTRIADRLGVSRAWLLLGDEARSPLDALPDYASQPLQLLAAGARSGKLDAAWFECMAMAARLLDQARGLEADASGFSAFLSSTTPKLSDQATELAMEYDKVTDPSQRRVAFAQTHHLLRLLQKPSGGDAGTTSEPSAQRK